MKILILLVTAHLYCCASSLNAQSSEQKIYGLTTKQHQQFEKYWERRAKIMTIQLRDSSTISGQAVFVENDKLFILQRPEIFLTPSNSETQIAVIALNDISTINLVDRVNRKRPRNIGAGIGAGVGIILGSSLVAVGEGYIPLIIIPIGAVAFSLPGGLIGWSFFPSKQDIIIYPEKKTQGNAAQIIEPLLIFPDSLPNAIKINENGLMKVKAESENSLKEMMSASPLIQKIYYNPKIAVAGNIGTTLLINDGLGYADHIAGLGLMYSLNQRLNLEYNFNKSEQRLYSRFNQVLDDGYLFEHYESRSNKRNHVFYLHYNLLPIRQFSNKYVRIAIAGGIDFSNWTGDVSYIYTLDNTDMNSNMSQAERIESELRNNFENSIIGFHSKLEIEYRLMKYVSIYTNLDKSFLSNNVYPSYDFIHPNTGQRVTDESHQSIRLTGLDWISGLRIWLY